MITCDDEFFSNLSSSYQYFLFPLMVLSPSYILSLLCVYPLNLTALIKFYMLSSKFKRTIKFRILFGSACSPKIEAIVLGWFSGNCNVTLLCRFSVAQSNSKCLTVRIASLHQPHIG